MQTSLAVRRQEKCKGPHQTLFAGKHPASWLSRESQACCPTDRVESLYDGSTERSGPDPAICLAGLRDAGPTVLCDMHAASGTEEAAVLLLS